LAHRRKLNSRELAKHGRSADSRLRAPFEWYGAFFLKVTHSISRAQELAADALAARVVGPGPLVSGLKSVHGGAAAYGAFIREEVAPVVSAGFRPPLVEGFKTFVDGKHIKQSLARLVSAELEGGESDELDTHPPLARRVEALMALGAEERETDDRSALELLDATEELEAELIREGERGPLEPLSWTKVVRKVYLPEWQKNAAKLGKRLDGPTLGSLVRSPEELAELADRVGGLDVSNHREVAPHFGRAPRRSRHLRHARSRGLDHQEPGGSADFAAQRRRATHSVQGLLGARQRKARAGGAPRTLGEMWSERARGQRIFPDSIRLPIYPARKKPVSRLATSIKMAARKSCWFQRTSFTRTI
jgi:hypothetical protein